MELVAEALSGFPGEKSLIYLGYSLGLDRFGHPIPGARQALKALFKARVSVFALDVTSASGHSLGLGLQNVARATGGTYASTFRLPGVATEKIARAISGWYVLTFDRAVLQHLERGRVRIELRDRHGEVLVRSVSLR
jgi:hypothetical protein